MNLMVISWQYETYTGAILELQQTAASDALEKDHKKNALK